MVRPERAGCGAEQGHDMGGACFQHAGRVPIMYGPPQDCDNLFRMRQLYDVSKMAQIVSPW